MYVVSRATLVFEFTSDPIISYSLFCSNLHPSQSLTPSIPAIFPISSHGHLHLFSVPRPPYPHSSFSTPLLSFFPPLRSPSFPFNSSTPHPPLSMEPPTGGSHRRQPMMSGMRLINGCLRVVYTAEVKSHETIRCHGDSCTCTCVVHQLTR